MSQAPREALDLVFAALADPTRRAILARLAAGEATVNELVAPSDLSQPTISKHLKVLEQAGASHEVVRPGRLAADTVRGRLPQGWAFSLRHDGPERRAEPAVRRRISRNRAEPEDRLRQRVRSARF